MNHVVLNKLIEILQEYINYDYTLIKNISTMIAGSKKIRKKRKKSKKCKTLKK